jgi:hypothetical protein
MIVNVPSYMHDITCEVGASGSDRRVRDRYFKFFFTMRRIDQFGDGKVLASFLDPKIEKVENNE